jgi:4-amino-4-deoxy-L-arabinose transferase-like glycosyltransferase
LSIFGLIGWLWFLSSAAFVWKAVSLAVLLAVAAIVSITWYVSRARASARAERQWRTALDAYAQKELAKRTNSRRKFHARPQTKDW